MNNLPINIQHLYVVSPETGLIMYQTAFSGAETVIFRDGLREYFKTLVEPKTLSVSFKDDLTIKLASNNQLVIAVLHVLRDIPGFSKEYRHIISNIEDTIKKSIESAVYVYIKIDGKLVSGILGHNEFINIIKELASPMNPVKLIPTAPAVSNKPERKHFYKPKSIKLFLKESGVCLVEYRFTEAEQEALYLRLKKPTENLLENSDYEFGYINSGMPLFALCSRVSIALRDMNDSKIYNPDFMIRIKNAIRLRLGTERGEQQDLILNNLVFVLETDQYLFVSDLANKRIEYEERFRTTKTNQKETKVSNQETCFPYVTMDVGFVKEFNQPKGKTLLSIDFNDIKATDFEHVYHRELRDYQDIRDVFVTIFYSLNLVKEKDVKITKTLDVFQDIAKGKMGSVSKMAIRLTSRDGTVDMVQLSDYLRVGSDMSFEDEPTSEFTYTKLEFGHINDMDKTNEERWTSLKLSSLNQEVFNKFYQEAFEKPTNFEGDSKIMNCALKTLSNMRGDDKTINEFFERMKIINGLTTHSPVGLYFRLSNDVGGGIVKEMVEFMFTKISDDKVPERVNHPTNNGPFEINFKQPNIKKSVVNIYDRHNVLERSIEIREHILRFSDILVDVWKLFNRDDRIFIHGGITLTKENGKMLVRFQRNEVCTMEFEPTDDGCTIRSLLLLLLDLQRMSVEEANKFIEDIYKTKLILMTTTFQIEGKPEYVHTIEINPTEIVL